MSFISRLLGNNDEEFTEVRVDREVLESVIYYSKKSKEEAESMAQDMTQLETAPIVEEQTNPEVTENGDNYQI